MIAINKVTKERVQVDPSNDDDVYYQLDKRLYDFIKEEPKDIGEIYLTQKPEGCRPSYSVYVIKSLEDLRHFYINEHGNIVKREVL